MADLAQPWSEEVVLEALAFAFHIAEWEAEYEDMTDPEAFDAAMRKAAEDHETFRKARNSMHMGDCTRQAQTCIRCHADRFDIKAAQVIQLFRYWATKNKG